MVIRAEPKVAPSDEMQIIKNISAREFFRLYPEIKRKYFWGGKLWIRSYFVETIGNASEEVFRQYVQDQRKVMDKAEENGSQLGLFFKIRSLAAELFIMQFSAASGVVHSLIVFSVKMIYRDFAIQWLRQN